MLCIVESRRLRRVTSVIQTLSMLQVHLLCLLARGMFVNKTVCNSEELQAYALSHIPGDLVTRPVAKHNVHALQKLIKWFSDWLPIDSDLHEAKSSPVRFCFVQINCTALLQYKTACISAV